MKNFEVYGAIQLCLVDKVGWAMYWSTVAAGIEPMYWVVYQDVDQAMGANIAARRDSFHPGLNLYLKVGENGDEQ